MIFAIRVDDYGFTATETAHPPRKTRDVGLACARRFHAAMGGLPYLAGIIAAEVDADGGAWLASKPEGLTTAIHGFHHSYNETPGVSEFAGKTIAQTRDIIEHCRRIIGPTPHLIAPFNKTPRSLLDACGFEKVPWVWAEPSSWPTPPSPHYEENGVWYIPAWARLYGAAGWAQGASTRALVDEARALRGVEGVAVLTLHLPWELARDPEFDAVKRLADAVADSVVSPDEFVSRIGR